MLPLLLILLGTFGVLTLIHFAGRRLSVKRRGQISLGMLFLVTAVSHFTMTDGMARMLPPIVPSREIIIYLSGVMEFLLAILLIWGGRPHLAGWITIGFFIAVFPSNIYAAWAHVDFGGHGAGPTYLLLRGPFQLFLIAWAYFSSHTQPL
jgi:uncharacterized membrane protein